MGCFASRFDKRNSNCSDLNTCGLNFIGGLDHANDQCPVDKFVLLAKKELQDQYATTGVTATNEDQVKEAFLATHKAVKELHEELSGLVAKSNGKDPITGGKYKLSEATAQLADVLKNFGDSGIEVPAEAAAGGEEEKKEGEEEKKEEAPAEMEGGEEGEEEKKEGEGEGEKPAAMAMNPHAYDDDPTDYKGWANVPGLFLRQATVNPYWGDLVKAQLLEWEFNYGKKDPKDKKWLPAAGLITSALATAAKESKEVWFSGRVGDDDFESLKAMADNQPIQWPGWTAGWATQGEATAALAFLGDPAGDQKTHNVVFHVTDAEVFPFVKCRLFGSRLAGKITKLETAGEVNTFEVTAEKWAGAANVADWEKALEAAKNAPAAAATAEEAKPEGEGDAKPEGEEEKKDDAAAE